MPATSVTGACPAPSCNFRGYVNVLPDFSFPSSSDEGSCQSACQYKYPNLAIYAWRATDTACNCYLQSFCQHAYVDSSSDWEIFDTSCNGLDAWFSRLQASSRSQTSTSSTIRASTSLWSTRFPTSATSNPSQTMASSAGSIIKTTVSSTITSAPQANLICSTVRPIQTVEYLTQPADTSNVQGFCMSYCLGRGYKALEIFSTQCGCTDRSVAELEDPKYASDIVGGYATYWDTGCTEVTQGAAIWQTYASVSYKPRVVTSASSISNTQSLAPTTTKAAPVTSSWSFSNTQSSSTTLAKSSSVSSWSFSNTPSSSTTAVISSTITQMSAASSYLSCRYTTISGTKTCSFV